MERRPRWSESPLQAACEPQNAGPRPWTCGEPAVRAVRHAGHAGVCLGNARSQRPGHLHSPSHPHQIPAPKLQLAHPRAREVGGGGGWCCQGVSVPLLDAPGGAEDTGRSDAPAGDVSCTVTKAQPWL